MKLESIQVSAYAGCKADERPISFVHECRRYKIKDIISRSLEEIVGEGMVRRFTVTSNEGSSFTLRYSENQDQWFLEG